VNATVRFLRLPQVLERRACSRAVLYRHIAAGIFPPPIRRGRRCSVWVEAEVGAVLAAEVAGGTADELRALVARLVAQRGAPAQSGGVAEPPRDGSGRFAAAAAGAR
jgi:prophage regulatory protein